MRSLPASQPSICLVMRWSRFFDAPVGCEGAGPRVLTTFRAREARQIRARSASLRCARMGDLAPSGVEVLCWRHVNRCVSERFMPPAFAEALQARPRFLCKARNMPAPVELMAFVRGTLAPGKSAALR